MDELVERLNEAWRKLYVDGDEHGVWDTLAEAEAALEAARAEVERLTLEMGRLQQQYDERTACVIVHRGSALSCSDAMRTAYFDERRRADKLEEALRAERRRWGDRWWDRLED